MSSADRVAHIDGQLMQLRITHTRFQRSINARYNKTEQSIYECLLLCLMNIFCAATNFGCIDSFSLPNSRNEVVEGDGFLWCYCCRFVLNSKRLLSILWLQVCVVASSIFMVLFPMLFLKFVNRMCRKLNKPQTMS